MRPSTRRRASGVRSTIGARRFANAVRSERLASVLVAGFALLALNVALHRPVTFSRPPDYPLTTDAGDAAQLTDGLRTTSGTLWTDRLAVGWGPAVKKPIAITIDLGKPRSIDEGTYNTAAGRGDGPLPERLPGDAGEGGQIW